MRQITKTVYAINGHPNKEKCFDWVRDNWHDLNEHSVNEVIDSLQTLKNKVGGSLDYSIGQFADHGEHVTFIDYDKDILNSLDADSCPLTGFCWDIEAIDGLKKGSLKSLLSWLHADSEHRYSDEGLLEHLDCNDYEFNLDGSIHND